MLESIIAFLNQPPTWAALLILFAGVFVIGYAADFFAVLIALALCGFVWFALGTFVAAFAIGWPVALFWVALAGVILYNMGWSVEKERYYLLTVYLVLLFALSMTIGTRLYELSVLVSFGVSLLVVIGYLIAGLGVAYAKWHFWNHDQREYADRVTVEYFGGLKGRHPVLVEEARKYNERGKDVTVAQPSQRHSQYREEPTIPVFTKPEELDAIAALPSDRKTLQTMPIPEPLKAAYLLHLEKNKQKVPSAFESKKRFFAWLGAWPGVFIHMVFSQLIERLWKKVYEMIEEKLNAVQRKIFKGREEFLNIR